MRSEVLKNPGIEAIHDLRVASRRFRAALGLFGPWMPAKKTAGLNKQCRKLTQLLGGLRNIDEATIFFRLHTSNSSGDGYQICRRLSELRPHELTRIKKFLSAFDDRGNDRIVRKAVAALQEQRVTDNGNVSMQSLLSDTGIALFQPVQELLPAAASPEAQKSRHALRIAIKKWRYFFELVAPVLCCDVSATLSKLKEYQTILGRMNDIAEFGTLCTSLKLSRHERRFVETTLQAEDDIQLQKLTTLIEQKPLTYTSPFETVLPLTLKEAQTTYLPPPSGSRPAGRMRSHNTRQQ